MEEMAGGVAVIGSGPAGLAAAWRLASAGRRVRVFEAEERVGGALRTETVAGVGADVAVQLLSAGYAATRTLLDGLGLSDRLVPVPGRDALWRDGAARGLRYGSAARMATSPALPTGLKLRLGTRYLPFLERHRGVLDMNDPGRAARAGLGGVSIAEWGREHVGEDFVELVAYPLLAAYYGVTPEETSAAFFHGVARAGMDVAVLGARDGVGHLAAAMARELAGLGVEIRTGSAVERLEATDDGVTLTVDGAGIPHDAVVVATPPTAAGALLPQVLALRDIPVRSTATLVLATRSPADTGWFGLSIPRSDPPDGTLAAVCVQEEKGTGVGRRARGAGDGPAGGALVVVPTPAAAERWVGAEPSAVLAEVLPQLERLLPGSRSRILEARLIRLHGAVWIPTPGHFERLDRLATGLPDRVALAGDYRVAPTVEGAVRSGFEAAARLTGVAG